MQQPAFVTPSGLSVCSKASSDGSGQELGAGAGGRVQQELGLVLAGAGGGGCVCQASTSPASPGAAVPALALPTEGPGWQGHPVTPSEVQGREEAQGSAGDWDLPFPICRGLGEEGCSGP